MKNLLILTLIILLSLSAFGCSPPDGKLKPVEMPAERLASTRYKNDTAIVETDGLLLRVTGEWSEKAGYSFEISMENRSAAEKTVDFDEVLLTGARLEKAENYLRRNAGTDPFTSAKDAGENIVRIKPDEKKTVYLLFKQEMKKEEYYAAGRAGDRVKIDFFPAAAVQNAATFEAVSTSDMQAL